jgi:hypothetical protein
VDDPHQTLFMSWILWYFNKLDNALSLKAAFAAHLPLRQ